VITWIVYGAVLFLAALVPLVAGPDQPSIDTASVSMTMTFLVMGLGTVFNAITNRRDPTSGLIPPILQAVGISLVPVGLLVLATELPVLQGALLSTDLGGLQWLATIGLALVLPLVIETNKFLHRRRLKPPVSDVEHAVNPQRALEPSGV
jgi:Ca2+-transporting ATPase